MLTNEAIEVHLSYLRPAVEAVQAELPELRKEIKALDDKLSGKIEALDGKLSAKIEALDGKLSAEIKTLDGRLSTKIETLGASLNGKIDQANKDRAAGDATLSEKIDKVTEGLMKIRLSQEGLKWFVSSLTLIASGISIAHSFGWL